MAFLFEPAFWMLLAASLSSWASVAFMRSIGKLRFAALLTIWIAATVCTGLLYGIFSALISAAISLVAGMVMLLAGLVWSGVKSMPNQRFEDR